MSWTEPAGLHNKADDRRAVNTQANGSEWCCRCGTPGAREAETDFWHAELSAVRSPRRVERIVVVRINDALVRFVDAVPEVDRFGAAHQKVIVGPADKRALR